jgi:hypothetical protein
MSLFTSTLLSLIIAGAVSPPACDGGASVNKEFKLRFGGDAAVGDGLKVKFSALVEDSRCPKGVDCIWEGNAKIKVELSGAGKESATFELNTNVEPKSASGAGYEISLLKLDPYPNADARPKEKDYVATLSVRRK